MIDELVLRRLWATCSIMELAKTLGVSAATVTRRAKALGLPAKRVSVWSRQPDPTEEEIEAGAEAAQSRWSKVKRQSRGGIRPVVAKTHRFH